MRLASGFRQAEVRLCRLNIPQVIAESLYVAARHLEAQVVEVLSQPPGQDHRTPWQRTGDLRESIGSAVDGNVAVVGSTSDVAVDQEMGTSVLPPRSFLASTAAGTVDDALASIAASIAQHLADR
jgi:phage gpG-like protein